MNKEQVFFVPGRQGLIDYAHEVNGEIVSYWGGKTLAEMEVMYPGVLIGDLETVHGAQQAALISPPKRITQAHYEEMLGVLPPEDWRGSNGCQSFKLSEYYSGNMTRIYARIGPEFFEFMDDARMPHEKIVEKITKAFGAPSVSTPS